MIKLAKAAVGQPELQALARVVQEDGYLGMGG